MYRHIQRRNIAIKAMNLTYRLWESWKDGSHPRTRQMALAAKTRGLIAYDNIMCLHYDR